MFQLLTLTSGGVQTLHKDTTNISINHYILLVTHIKIPYSCDSPRSRATRKLSDRATAAHDATIYIDRRKNKKSFTLTGEALLVFSKRLMSLKDFVGPIGFEPMTLCL